MRKEQKQKFKYDFGIVRRKGIHIEYFLVHETKNSL